MKKKKDLKPETKREKIVKGILLFIFGIIVGVTSFYTFLYAKYIWLAKEYVEDPDLKLAVRTYNASMVMLGDALIHSGVYGDALTSSGEYDFSPMFEKLAPLVEGYDIAFYNQETIFGGEELGYSSYPCFNTPSSFGDNMINMGFNLVSLANNHTLDKGETGIRNSLEYWSSKDVITAGSYSSFEEEDDIEIGEINGITYAFLAYTTLTNGFVVPSGKEYLVSLYSEDKVREDVESIRDKVDVLIVSMHWGTEYVHDPIASQKEQAQYLSSLGVDLVIGHHPHVIEPIEYIGDTLIIYSLGNLISSQIGIDRLSGLMVTLDIEKVNDNGAIDISFKNIEGSFIYTYYTPARRDFMIYPYGELTNTILSGYESYYEEYSDIITSLSDEVSVKPLVVE